MYNEIIYLGLGTNLRSNSFISATKLFNSVIYRINLSGLRVIKSSNSWLSLPIPYTAGPLFFNKVLKCINVEKRKISPLEIFDKLSNLEIILGKKKKYRYGARLIDIDILDYDGMVYNNDIILPHPKLHLRKFVLNPLESIDKDWTHPALAFKIPQLRAQIKEYQKLKEILS